MVTHITQDNFGSKKNRPYKIKCPGNYRLEENIVFHPESDGTAAIIIDSDDVTLQLNGRSLSQNESSYYTKYKTTGILIRSGHKNITVSGGGGSVRNFSQRGIYLQGGNSYVNFDTFTVTGCGYGTDTLLFDGKEGVIQVGVQLGDTQFFPFFGVGKYHGIVEHVQVSDITVSQNCMGLQLGEGNNFRFSNCSISNNTEHRKVWSKFTSLNGFFIVDSCVCYGLVYFSNPSLTPDSYGVKNCVFQNCKFNQNSAKSTSESLMGAYCDSFIMAVNYEDLKIINCQFNGNYTSLTPKGKYRQTRGLVLGAGYSTVIEDSEFCDNKGGNFVSGFNLSGLIANNNPSGQASIFQSRAGVMRNCVASGNIANPSTNEEFSSFPPNTVPALGSFGYMIRYPSCFTLENCNAEHNKVVLPTGTGTGPTVSCIADGVFIYSDRNFPCQFSNSISIKGCKLCKNRVVYSWPNSYNDNITATSSGIRIYDDLCENILIQDCFITNNLPGIDETPYPLDTANYASAGIDLFNQSPSSKTGPSYVTIVNNEIQSNGTYGIYNNLDYTKIQNNNINYHTTSGVFLDAVTNYVSVLDNTLLYNTVAVIDFLSTNCTNSSSLVAGNKSASYPTTDNSFQVWYCSSGGPGCVPGCAAPVATGELINFPVYTADTKLWTNIEIKNSTPAPVYPPQECVLQTGVSSREVSSRAVTKNDMERLIDIRKKLFKRQ